MTCGTDGMALVLFFPWSSVEMFRGTDGSIQILFSRKLLVAPMAFPVLLQNDPWHAWHCMGHIFHWIPHQNGTWH